jgi:hypothetical protein
LPPGSREGTVQILAGGLVKAVLPIKPDEIRSFAFDVNTNPFATEKTITIEFRAPALVTVGDRKLGVVVSGLKMSAACR